MKQKRPETRIRIVELDFPHLPRQPNNPPDGPSRLETKFPISPSTAPRFPALRPATTSQGQQCGRDERPPPREAKQAHTSAPPRVSVAPHST